MIEILTQTAVFIKAVGEKAMLQLAKSIWIKFCIGASLLLLSGGTEIIKALMALK